MTTADPRAPKLPAIPDPGNDLRSVLVTVRAIAYFCDILAKNSTGVAQCQLFELGPDADPTALRAELRRLREEFDAYVRSHP